MNNLKIKEIITQAINDEDGELLAKTLFNFDLTPTQIILTNDILFSDNKKFSVSAMTRYGKSQIIAITVGIFLLINNNKKVYFIAPTKDQAQILRNYLNDLVLSCSLLLELSDLQLESEQERLKSEVSKSRVTFKNGCEYRVFTAHLDGSGMMGFGLGNQGGWLILDEACKISREANTKILRMLGDNPENSKIIELYNPWDRDNKAYEHSINEDWTHYQIGWQLAVKEDRATKDFIDGQRKELTPLEFEVLYDSKFPETSEDSIFNFKYTQKAIDLDFTTPKNITRIISCDPADKGLDKTVIMNGFKDVDSNIYVVEDIYSEPQSENMLIAERIFKMYNKTKYPNSVKTIINVDTIGVGIGVVSRLRQLFRLISNVTIVACHFGEGVGTVGKETMPQKTEKLLERRSDSARKRYLNRKSEQYFRLKELFEENLISIPKKKELITNLMNMKWDFTTSGKIKIIDPERSPDFSDCLVYFCWKVKTGVTFNFA